MPKLPHQLFVLPALNQTFPKHLVRHRRKVFRVRTAQGFTYLFVRQDNPNQIWCGVRDMVEGSSLLTVPSHGAAYKSPLYVLPLHSEEFGQRRNRTTLKDDCPVFLRVAPTAAAYFSGSDASLGFNSGWLSRSG